MSVPNVFFQSPNSNSINKLKINPDKKKRWIDALRSGEYKQGRGELRDLRNRFCCLGVLCDLHSKEFKIEWKKSTNPVMGYLYEDRSDVQPSDVSLWAWPKDGHTVPQVIINDVCGTLDYHNDRGCTFAEIADAIEEQL